MPLDDIKSVEQLAADIKADHAKATDAVKEIAEKALAEAKKGVESSASLKENADEQLLKMNELTEQITSIEQKLARAKEFDERAKAAKSIGQQFVEAEDVKSLLDSDVKRGKAQMLLKATITSATTDTAGAAGAAVEATRLPGVVADPNRRMTIRDLLMPGQMDGSTLEYVQETGFNNNAAPVAEGAAKPQSDIKLALISTTAKVIAHTAKASRQILDDAAQMRSYIDGRLRYGLAFKEEQQLLSGDGTGQNLLGIIPQATAYSAAFAPAAETVIDKLRLAMLQAALAEYPATGHVMNPIDWARVELTKDSEGRYIIGNPGGEGPATLWKLPVVETQAIAVDKFLTGAFRLGAQVFDRWQARVELATENEDDFVKNMVTMLCEERLALAVYRPEAFIYGDLGFVA
ncbi:phage major capsid protein [Pseudooceanicola nitratireducens]|uniref:phage major capsid protein n=1 Tax=Pseudooceanicola nitratireducens TaxID=517719 RepID=UPI0023F00D4E|nr:phage major capsid protein [Pseudooceanicola nitratireducens]